MYADLDSELNVWYSVRIGGHMDKRFKKNDKLLFHAYIIVDVLAILILLSFILSGIFIIICSRRLNWRYAILGVLLIVPIGPIIAYVLWVLARVLLNLCCDVKLIRNKLYDKSNAYLEELTEEEADGQAVPDSAQKTPKQMANINNEVGCGYTDNLKKIEALLAEGALTQEEFDAEKKKLMSRDSYWA